MKIKISSGIGLICVDRKNIEWYLKKIVIAISECELKWEYKKGKPGKNRCAGKPFRVLPKSYF
jgi:hypothetical protein